MSDDDLNKAFQGKERLKKSVNGYQNMKPQRPPEQDTSESGDQSGNTQDQDKG